jgi:hypothetical protein
MTPSALTPNMRLTARSFQPTPAPMLLATARKQRSAARIASTDDTTRSIANAEDARAAETDYFGRRNESEFVAPSANTTATLDALMLAPMSGARRSRSSMSEMTSSSLYELHTREIAQVRTAQVCIVVISRCSVARLHMLLPTTKRCEHEQPQHRW